MLSEKINQGLNLIKNLSDKEIIRLILGIIIFISAIFGFLIYRYYSQVNSLIKQINYSNKLRSEAKELISRNLAVKKQQEKVDEIISKDKNFKLMEYFNNLSKEIRLNSHVTSKQININEIDTKQDYIEVILNINISNINMKQLTDLLLKIETNERIYIKKLDISKSNKLPAIDVNIVLATLQSKTE